MRLDNFKELLLRKSNDNQNLQLLIKYMRDDYLVNHVVESLEKMAASYSKKNPNAAIMHHGTHMDPETGPEMIHDYLSHHASHYKAALNSGDEGLADKHMRKIFNLMHMSEKMTKDGLNDHSHGKLKIEAIHPMPWERGGFTNTKNRKGEDTGKFTTDTKGWSRDSSSYKWLRGAPHGDSRVEGDGRYAKEVSVHGHNKAYPLEEMKVNGKHIHIDDIESPGKFTEHIFDSHPVMSHYKSSPSSHDSLKHDEYLKAHDAFHDDGGGMDSYFDIVEARHPDDHAARGSVKAKQIHKEVPGLDLGEGLGTAQSIQAPAPKEGPVGKEGAQSALAALKDKFKDK